MVKRTTLVIFILLSIFIIGGIGIYLNKKLDKTLEKMESKIEEKENKVDSLQNRLNYIYEVIDSLPIGPPSHSWKMANAFRYRHD
jgi:peptidoglycan hydrolase CwlO-like protein